MFVANATAMGRRHIGCVNVIPAVLLTERSEIVSCQAAADPRALHNTS